MTERRWCPPKMDAQPLLRFRVVFTLCEYSETACLILFQHADTKLFFSFEQRMHVCAVVYATRTSMGSERDGSERVGGHAVDLPGSRSTVTTVTPVVEMAQCFAEFG